MHILLERGRPVARLSPNKYAYSHNEKCVNQKIGEAEWSGSTINWPRLFHCIILVGKWPRDLHHSIPFLSYEDGKIYQIIKEIALTGEAF
jgi:hypothetical protein